MSDETIQWGALYRLPTGEQVEEIGRNRSDATNLVHSINHDLGEDTAKLAYRTVTNGPWSTGGTGDEWAVRHRWDDGGEEIEPTDSRHFAETRTSHGRNLREVVSRSVTYGQWWLAGAAVTT